jgi:4'-phosphopantetheinyl transferase
MFYLSEYRLSGTLENRKKEHALGRTLLSYGLSLEYGIKAEVLEEQGQKPRLKDRKDIFFNISHTLGLVVCGISTREIGVDVEKIRPFKERVMKRICTETEQKYIGENSEHFFRIWTLKESYLKAIGAGLAKPMREMEFWIQNNENEIQTDTKIVCSIEGWKFSQFLYAGSYVVSICEQNQGGI